MKKIIVSIFAVGWLLATSMASVNAFVAEKETLTGQIVGSIPLNMGGNTLYVGGDGPGNYSSIQDAINAASDGDTIFVYKGTYTDFTVDKQLTIIGESREETVVKLGWSHTNKIRLKSNGIELTNFTFKGNPENVDRMLEITGHYCNVSYCTLVPSDYPGGMPLNGIRIGWCSYVTISNCELIGFPYWAITCMDVTNCYIENCTIRNSYRGVYTMGPNQHVYVINCEIYNCGWDEFKDGAAIVMDSSSHNHVIKCDIHDNAKGIDICSSYNDIINCDIHDNAKGIDIWGIAGWYPSHNNIITNNNFYYNNKVGLIIGSSCYDNYVYHNNFLINGQGNAVDSGSNNVWDDNYPSGGNYWDDYDGEDNDGDGIGDTPYNIPGESNSQDRYPLMDMTKNIPPMKPNKPSGPTTGKKGVEYTYSSSTEDPNDDPLYYKFSWGDGDESEWLGPYESGETATASYTWTVSGKHQVKVRAKDEGGLLSKWSDSLSVDVSIPDPPIITGRTSGRPGVEYEYTFVTTDPDGDDVSYWINWWDWTDTGWLGPFPSGEEITVSHTWEEKDVYIIHAKAKDIDGAESDWGTLTVTMPKNLESNQQSSQQQSSQSQQSQTLPSGQQYESQSIPLSLPLSGGLSNNNQ